MNIKISLLFLILICFEIKSQNFQWVKGFGGYFDDGASSIVTDKHGNVYTTGSFNTWVDFDPGIGTYTLNANGGGATPDIFISKLDANGNFKWAKSFGSTGFDSGLGCTVDSEGNLYTIGIFSGTVDFDPGMNVYNLTASGTQDIYINKFDTSGNFLWAKHAGGSATYNHYAYATAISCDNNGNVFIAGNFIGWIGFNTGTGTNVLASSGSYDFFVLKLDTDGNYIWAKKAGGTASDQVSSIAIGKYGNIYLTGIFEGTCDFDPGVGIFNISSTNASTSDVFILKLNSTGNFIWVKRTGNSNYDQANSINLDALENVYTTGNFSGTVDFDPGSATHNLIANPNTDAFISKLDSSGNFVWANKIGDSSGNSGSSLKVDSLANIFITGYFSGNCQYTDGASTYTLQNAGNTDVFILKLDSAGSLLWSQRIGGSQNEFSQSICIDPNENVYICGNYTGTSNFDFGPPSVNLTSNGGPDIFILKSGSGVAGIKEQKSTVSISILPNPNNGNFLIKGKEKMKLNLIDNLSRIIQSFELDEANYFQQNINIHSSGIYYIIGTNDTTYIKQKIIVTK